MIVKSDVESILKCAKRSAETDLNDCVWFRFEDQVDLGTQGEYGGVRRFEHSRIV